MNAINVMICTPFHGMTDSQIKRSIDYCKRKFYDKINEHYTEHNIDASLNYICIALHVEWHTNYVNYTHPLMSDGTSDYSMFCCANGLSNIMCLCDYIVFGENWMHSRGCLFEAIGACLYGKTVFGFDEQGHIIDTQGVYAIAVEELRRLQTSSGAEEVSHSSEENKDS